MTAERKALFDAPSSRPYVSWYGGKRSQTWRTPQQFFQALNIRYGFTMDGAASGPSLMAIASTPDNPLPWEGERVFCNPPWSNIQPFVELAARAEFAALLVPARTNAGWFHRALELGAKCKFFPGRITFVGAKGQCPVDCLLLLFGNEEWFRLGNPANEVTWDEVLADEARAV